MTNAEKYANQIAVIIANSSDGVCQHFTNLGILRCWVCPLQGKCKDQELIKKWLLQEENECIVRNQALKEDKTSEIEALVSKSEWISLCQKYGQWCNFEDVKNFTLEEAEYFIKNMPCWEPM